MKGLAITSIGIEDIAALEIKEILKTKVEIKDSCVIFDINKIEDLALLSYRSQSIERVLLLLKQSKSLEDLKVDIEKKWLKKSFKVACKKIENEISSEEVCNYIGDFIDAKVDLDNPHIIFFVFIVKDDFYLGVDFSGFDMHKREYRIFLHPSALRSTIAYAMVRIAGVNEKTTMLDPFTGSGTIPIESAMFLSGMPQNFHNKEKFAFNKFMKFDFNDKKIKEIKTKITGYDSILGYIMNAKKNAKIAGVEKMMTFSKVEIEWLDTKMDKESVDRIVTQPPEASKVIREKDTEKVYNEFFNQADYVLKNDGLIVIITRNNDLLKKAAERCNYKSKDERKVMSGKQEMIISEFEK